MSEPIVTEAPHTDTVVTDTQGDTFQQDFEKEFKSALGEEMPGVEVEPGPDAPVSEPAPPEDNTATEQPPSETQPDQKAETPDTEQQTTDQTKADGQTEATTVVQPDDEAQKMIQERLGLAALQPDTVEGLKEKLKASSTEGHRLAEERKGIDLALKGLNVKLAVNKDGEFGLKPLENYEQELKDEDILDVYASLTEDEKSNFIDDPSAAAKKIAKRVATDLIAKRPKVNLAVGEVTPATIEQINEARATLKDAKLSDNSPKYEGCEELDKIMYEILTDPSTPDSFRDGFNQNVKWYMQALHGMAYRAYAPVMAVKRQAVVDKKGKQAKAQSLPSTSSDSPAIQAPRSTGELSDHEYAKRIAMSDMD